ncbi:ABC-F family ATP-binding cassette domain-containing protein [Amycolatopsis suaedae]|uniref:ABC-F family ATP-binding cassette domain-containing protein n=1 Tax=Amycolatopsis suaedae TaxID=2510978 RepID=A0A4Q7J9S2_9PSEU|nr:ABC-F family ATP-binding cassette domain-containing protein [Amycolatopsis suaedae]RZQ63696.1 ABC-F family ATP-binding cassette domain-containing protein [Amycolatopsis suaedae]
MSTSTSLLARDLVFAYRDRVVLDGFSLTASPGQRIGLVGENGAGKSTLLRLLAGTLTPLGGTVQRGGDLGFLHQELPFPASATLADVLDDALAETRATAARLDELAGRLAEDPGDEASLDEYGRALEWAQAHDLWDADRRAGLVCAGLGLGGIAPDRMVGTLSGGQRSRLGLAALLIRRPATLLLDEPTNHLDDPAMEFLEQHLAALPGTVVLASHDRVFLDAVCTDIVDLDPALGGPARYGGAYTAYLGHKKAERARWEQRYAEEQEELKRLAESVRVTARAVAPHDRAPRDPAKMLYDFKTGRVQKQVSRRVRNAQQRLDRLEREQVRKPPAPLRFAAPLTGNSRVDRAVSVRAVTVTGRLHIGHLDVDGAARLLVTGGNGAGKSTLLRLLDGALRPDRGMVFHGPGVRTGLLEQDVEFADPARSPRELYRRAAGERAVALAELGLVAPRDLDRPVGSLSVGQRRRVALATLLGDPPQVLLLDEPTNHISLTLAEELFAALDSAPGAVVVASHDRWLRRGWDGAELRLRDGEVA